MKEYEFFARCVPEEWKRQLSERVREEQARQLDRKENEASWAALKLTWREEWEFDFRFTRWETFRGSGVRKGAKPGGTSLEAGAWLETTAAFSETFRGRLAHDGVGGSVLRGHFRLWGLSSIFLTLFGLACTALAILIHTPLLWLGTVVAAAQLARHWIRLDRYPTSQTVLAFLEDVAKDCDEVPQMRRSAFFAGGQG